MMVVLKYTMSPAPELCDADHVYQVDHRRSNAGMKGSSLCLEILSEYSRYQFASNRFHDAALRALISR